MDILQLPQKKTKKYHDTLIQHPFQHDGDTSLFTTDWKKYRHSLPSIFAHYGDASIFKNKFKKHHTMLGD